MSQITFLPRGLVRYIHDDVTDEHLLLCETSVTVSAGGTTRVEPLPDAAAASLCASMVNTLFDAKQRWVEDLDIINLTLYQARAEWFSRYVPGSHIYGKSASGRGPKINTYAFPEDWRGSKLNIETGLGGHYFKSLVYPKDPCHRNTAHDLDTQHQCTFRIHLPIDPILCTDADGRDHWLSLRGSPEIRLCHPRDGLGASRLLPTSKSSTWARLTGDTMQKATFRQDTLTALRFGRVWSDVIGSLEQAGAQSLKKMGLTCHEIRSFPFDYNQQLATPHERLVIPLPSLSTAKPHSPSVATGRGW